MCKNCHRWLGTSELCSPHTGALVKKKKNSTHWHCRLSTKCQQNTSLAAVVTLQECANCWAPTEHTQWAFQVVQSKLRRKKKLSKIQLRSYFPSWKPSSSFWQCPSQVHHCGNGNQKVLWYFNEDQCSSDKGTTKGTSLMVVHLQRCCSSCWALLIIFPAIGKIHLDEEYWKIWKTQLFQVTGMQSRSS